MFGKFFLLILSALSLAWIVFIGYDLLDKKDQISPQNIFDLSDGAIVIINRSNETQAENSHFQINEQIKPLAEKLLKSIFPNERIYFSEKRAIVIIELQRIWNKELVHRYLTTKQEQFTQNGEEFVLSSGFKVRFKKNYLMITSLDNLIAHTELEWPTWDNKASASILFLSNPLKSTNIYFKANGTISYQTKYGKILNCKRVDDRDLFAQYLPSKINNYHFYEKVFALNSLILNEKSPLNQWIEDGFIQFDYLGTKCLISDYNKSVDPFQLLASDRESNDLLSNHFKDVQITRGFPKSIKKGFYIGKVGDKVLLSEKKEVLEKIIADYQLGNTLALDKNISLQVYEKMPKKVSERLALNKDYFALSSYKNLLIKTTLNSFAKLSDSTVQSKPSLVKNSSFSISEETKTFLGNGKFVYSIGAKNEILCISNKKQFWKVNLEGNIIGELKLIDLNENGKQQILVNTDQKIYLINAESGSFINEFPVNLKAQNSVSSYRWNRKTNFVVVNTANELVQIDQNGRTTKKLRLSAESVLEDVNVYRKGNVLVAIVVGSNKTQEIDLDNNRVLKSNINLAQRNASFKIDGGFAYFSMNNKQLIWTNLANQSKTLSKGEHPILFKKLFRGKEMFAAYFEKDQLILLDKNGNTTNKILIKVSDVDDFDVITLANGKTYIAILEGIENNIYLFDGKGNQLLEKTFEGKKAVKLSDDTGKLTLTSNLDRNIVQHYDILNQ